MSTSNAGSAVKNVHRQAARQLRKVRQAGIRSLPELLTELVSNPRCHSEVFCRRYIEHCSEEAFHRPRRALILAVSAPAFVQTLPKSESRDELQTAALTILGLIQSDLGSLARAEESFELALKRSRHASAAGKANLLIGVSYLRSLQEQPDEARNLVDEVIDLLEESGDPEKMMPRALLRRGATALELRRPGEAVADFGAALIQAHPRRAPQVFHSAVHNLGVAAVESPHLEDLKAALHFITKANELLKPRKMSIPRAKLIWLQGKLYDRLGSTRLAETRFRAARHYANRLGAPYEVVLISLDLARLLLTQNRWADLEDLVRDTSATFGRLSKDGATANTLWCWQQAIDARTFTEAVIDSLLERVASRRSCPSTRRP